MEWLKQILKEAGIENVDDLESKISKELPKYFKPANVFNETNEKLKTANAEIETLKTTQKSIQDEYENYKKGSISKEEYENKVKEIQAEADKNVKQSKFDSKLDFKLISKEIGAKDPKEIRAHLDTSKISLDGENFIGLDEQIKPLKENKAYLFNIDREVNNGVENNGGNPRKNEGETLDDDELDKLSDEEYFALQEKNNK